MKKLRRIWLALVIITTALFGCYRYMEVKKADSSGPVLSIEEDKIQTSIHDGEDFLLQGVTALDKKDGDVTSSVIVENISRFYICGNVVFFEVAELIEHVEEKTELTVNNANYSYKLYNLKTNAINDYSLSNGYAKAYFNQTVNGYIEVFEEKYVNDVKQLGKFTYYDCGKVIYKNENLNERTGDSK